MCVFSYDALTAVLYSVVGYGAPVVVGLGDQAVSELLCSVLAQSFVTLVSWEEILLHDAHSLLTLDKTGQIALPHHHHLD